MGRTACTEPQCLYKGALYLYLIVQLYLYSPYGPYRASVPVQGCTLPLPNSIAIPLLPLWAVRPVQCPSACTRVHFTFFFIFTFYSPVSKLLLLQLQKVRNQFVHLEFLFCASNDRNLGLRLRFNSNPAGYV